MEEIEQFTLLVFFLKSYENYLLTVKCLGRVQDNVYHYLSVQLS